MKTVFHVSDGDDDVLDAAIRYAGGIFSDESVEIEAVAVVANASGIDLVRADSAYAEDITELSKGDVQFIACEKSMHAAGLTVGDIHDAAETASTSVGVLTELQDEGYRYIKVP